MLYQRTASLRGSEGIQGQRVTSSWSPSASLRLEARECDDLGPLLDFVADELTELICRHRGRFRTDVGKFRLQRGTGKARVDLFVEPRDDFGRRILRRGDAMPRGRLESRQHLGHRRTPRQA